MWSNFWQVNWMILLLISFTFWNFKLPVKVKDVEDDEDDDNKKFGFCIPPDPQKDRVCNSGFCPNNATTIALNAIMGNRTNYVQKVYWLFLHIELSKQTLHISVLELYIICLSIVLSMMKRSYTIHALKNYSLLRTILFLLTTTSH